MNRMLPTFVVVLGLALGSPAVAGPTTTTTEPTTTTSSTSTTEPTTTTSTTSTTEPTTTSTPTSTTTTTSSTTTTTDPKGKVEICHKGRKTKRVNAHAVEKHLEHGDTLGPCPDGDGEDD